MNTEIATMCATRPEDALRARTNEVLNRFDADLARIRRAYPVVVVLADGEATSVAAVQAASRIRLREMHKRVARVVVQLHAAGVR